MPDIGLQAIEGQDHMTLLVQPGLDLFSIADAQAHQFFIPSPYMRDFSLRDRKTAGHQALMHFRDTAMLREAPGANARNHLQTKLPVGQRPPSFQIADDI
jgi:hypothetical protein